jgi:hypothetical protein
MNTATNALGFLKADENHQIEAENMPENSHYPQFLHSNPG